MVDPIKDVLRKIKSRLPPRNPESGTRQNYLPLYLLKLPPPFGIGVDGLFSQRHESDHDKLMLVNNTSLDLPSFLKIGMSALAEGSPLYEKLVSINQEIVMWLDEWVAPKDSPNTERDKPIYRQVSKRILKEADEIQSIEKRDTFVNEWWENLKLLRFLMGKGSAASIMLNRQNGIDTATLSADLMALIETQEISDKKLLSRILKLSQGPDLDFAVFPTDVYQEVFDEFWERKILKKVLGNDAVQVSNLVEDEIEKYELSEISENDIKLPQGFKLHSKKLFCSLSTGRIPQKTTIPYYDIIYHVKIINPKDGQILPYKILALEFMPSTVDESTVDEDSRTGWQGSLLSQLRSAGVFLVNSQKRFSPTWLQPEDRLKQGTTGLVAKLDSSIAEAMTLPDFPVGSRLNNMLAEDSDFDHSFVATLLGRSLRDGLFDSLNIMTKNQFGNHPFSRDYYQIFRLLSEKFKPEMVSEQNKMEMELGLFQGWMLDFPLLINFLNSTGFAKHLVMGQNAQVLQAITDIAKSIERSPYYESFLTKLVKAKEQSKEGKPAKIDEANLQQMVMQNLTRVMKLIKEDKGIPSSLKEGKSDFEILSELISMPINKELPIEKSWGADLEVSVIDLENLKKHLVDESKKLGKPIFGYRSYNAGASFIYHMSRYPRTIKYNVGSVEEYEIISKNIAGKMKLSPPKIESRSDKPRFRIVLGLNDGYSREKTFLFDEVKRLLGEKFNCHRGKVLTANALLENPIYEEPTIIIEGDIDDIKKVYQVAELYGQERFAVELLDTQDAFIVETRHCKNSDLDIKPNQT